MTDNDVIKAWQCCAAPSCNCKECPMEGINGCWAVLKYKTLNLINRQKAENDDLFYKLSGVMWFVDKWLDGDELKQDEVQRAITMREKTLQITEEQQKEIERLQSMNQAKLDTIHDLMAEIESLKEALKDLKHEMSYMSNPNTIGDRHEMGCW